MIHYAILTKRKKDDVMVELDVARIEKRKKLLEELNKVFEKRFKDEEWLRQQSEIYQGKAKEIDRKMYKNHCSYF